MGNSISASQGLGRLKPADSCTNHVKSRQEVIFKYENAYIRRNMPPFVRRRLCLEDPQDSSTVI
jgi:hypothetical protein